MKLADHPIPFAISTGHSKTVVELTLWRAWMKGYKRCSEVNCQPFISDSQQDDLPIL
jgi:hypothetical protein